MGRRPLVLTFSIGSPDQLLDTIRIARTNAESELAGTLAPHLSRPREAKKALANLWGAPLAILRGRR